MTRLLCFVYLLLVLFLVGCRSLQPNRITWNESKQVYVAKFGLEPVILRTSTGELVKPEHLDSFLTDLKRHSYVYPFAAYMEPAALVQRSDWDLAEAFQGLNQALQNQAYNQAFGYANDIRSLYPKADWYTNLAFLEGYAFEQLGLIDEAKKKYARFLAYSSQVYSRRQRGYEAADPKDSLLRFQRTAALHRLNNIRTYIVQDFPPLPPKYPYTPFQPGFSERAGTSIALFSQLYPYFGWDIADNLSVGLHYQHPLSPSVRVFSRIHLSKAVGQVTIGSPIQAYKAFNDRFGLKITPYLSYQWLKKPSLNGQLLASNEGYIDGGLELSASYFLKPKLSVGAYYIYHVYNQNHPYLSTLNQPLYTANELDLSLYYSVLENLSLKAGIKNDNLIVGFFLSGWDIAWSLNHQRLLFSTNLY